jgi:hypothetical protein
MGKLPCNHCYENKHDNQIVEIAVLLVVAALESESQLNDEAKHGNEQHCEQENIYDFFRKGEVVSLSIVVGSFAHFLLCSE